MFSIGADPEVFLRNKKTGKFVSSHDIIPGTKERPHWLVNGYGAIQVDGVAAEFNVNVSNTRVDFVGNVGRIMTVLGNTVKRKNKDLELACVPTVDFDDEYFNTIPEENRQLGCNADWNAWTEYYNEPPNSNTLFRTGSGHVHVSWGKGYFDPNNNDIFDQMIKVAREMDYYLGLPSLIWDKDNRRRELYGRAGAFRPKSYGIEYRVLSNQWLNSTKLIEYVYDATKFTIDQIEKKRPLLQDKYGNLCETIINNNEDWVPKYGNILGRELPEV